MRSASASSRLFREGDVGVPARSTVVCGCGGGHTVALVLPRLVLDADALNAIAAESDLRALLGDRARRGAATALTPHPLEAARLLGTTSAAVQADRLAAAWALAERDGCVVVLKGSGTVVAAPGGALFVNPTGNATLATAGTGDVLAGWLGGLWAQRQRDSVQALEVALPAVYVHGAAPDQAKVSPLRAADLVELMLASQWG